MAVTYEPIASQTLTSNTTTVTFSDISGSFTDLRLVCAAYGTFTSSGSGLAYLRFNSDTGSNYSITFLYGTGSSAGSYRASSQTRAEFAQIGATTTTTSTFIPIVADIMSYANTSVNKTFLSAAGADSTSPNLGRYVGLWRSTSAITSITISTSLTNFASGSTFALYGIKAA